MIECLSARWAGAARAPGRRRLVWLGFLVPGLAVAAFALAAQLDGAAAFASDCAVGTPYNALPDPQSGPPVSGPDGGVWFPVGTTGGEAIGRLGMPLVNPYCVTTYSLNGMLIEYLAVGADGNIWFTDPGLGSSTGAIGRLNPITGAVSSFSSGLIDGSHPWQIALAPDGDMWFTTQNGDDGPAVGRITPSGQITEFDAGINPNVELEAITAGPDGNMWFTANSPFAGYGAIGKVTPDGTITMYPLGTDYYDFGGITAGPDGDVWFTADYSNGDGSVKGQTVGKITPAGATTLFTSTVAGVNVGGIAVGPDGNLYTPAGTGMLEISTSGDVVSTINYAGGDIYSLPVLATMADGNVWGAGGPFTGPYGVVGPAASVTPPSVTGPNEPGMAQTCGGAVWATWDGHQPSADAYVFDGYQWQLDGSVVAQGQSFTPSVADLGQTLTCTQTVTYALPFVTAAASSVSVTVGGATGPTGATGSSGATGPTTGSGASSGLGGAQQASGGGGGSQQSGPSTTTTSNSTSTGSPQSGASAASTLVGAPLVTALRSHVSRSGRYARFTFGHRGDATTFECALVRVRRGHDHNPAPVYSPCESPKTYRHLAKGGTYDFYVRALGPGGTEKPSITRHVTIV